MPLTRNILRTYNAALYAARGTVNSIRALKRYRRHVQATTHGASKAGELVSRVQQQTRGNLAGHRTAYSRSVLAGQARRDALAKALRKKPRPLRARQGGPIPTLATTARTHPKGQVSIRGAVARSRTYGDLKRRLMVQATQEYTRSLGKNRQERAAAARQLRNSGYKPLTQQQIRQKLPEFHRLASLHLKRNQK